MAGEKTEKATPKRREEARKKGQVAKSQDLNGAVVLLAGLFALGVAGPSMAQRLGEGLREALALGSQRDAVTSGTVGDILMTSGRNAAFALAPVVGACALAAIVVSVLQVGIKPKTQALKPDARRLNPAAGFKRIFGKDAVFETGKNIIKVAVVGAVVIGSLLPHVSDYAAMVGMSPIQFGGEAARGIRSIAMRAALVYLLIGVVDFIYQRWRHEKSLRMDKQEVKEEAKQQDLPAEVRGAIRRRQREAARARMMADVPTADVVVTNPTHFSVALRYDSESAAPIVVAKGQDLLALRIREIAGEHGVPIVPNPPLARSLYATVEIGQLIPEELFQAVAQVLAYVYRVAGRRRLAS